MVKRSTGLLMYRRQQDEVEVFLVHPGGPYWASKDQGVWTIPHGEFFSLGEVRQKNGKLVTAWAFQGDCDPAQVQSNTCEIDWPPKSGKRLEIPEIDRGRWFTMDDARRYIRQELDELLLRLISLIAQERGRE